MEVKDRAQFLKTPLGSKLKAAIIKMIMKKVEGENSDKIKAELFSKLEEGREFLLNANATDLFSPRLQETI